jgi:hypothetical protein
MLSFFNLPCAGFCEMSELLTVPLTLIGNRQLPPGATPMSPVEFSPQSASVIEVEQSEAARTKDTGIKPAASAMSAKATALDDPVVDFLIFMQNPTDQDSPGQGVWQRCPGQSAANSAALMEPPVPHKRVRRTRAQIAGTRLQSADE